MEDLKIDTLDNSTIIVSDVDQDEEASPMLKTKSEERKLRKRTGSTDIIHGTKNKAIKKSKDNPGSFKSEKDAKKFYLNINKNIKVKPVLLETIFEEEDEEEDSMSSQMKQLGKASKRTLTIKDGHNISKTLTNKRKNTIKKKLGNRKKPRKVALKTFIENFKRKTSE